MFHKFVVNFKKQFYQTLIKDSTYKLFFQGIRNTIVTTCFSVIIGFFIGLITAILRVLLKNKKKLKILSNILEAYVVIIRGTPLVVQLMIFYYVIFSKFDQPLITAILCMGINSGAYISEIMRGGISSVEKGQIEAGECLGLSYPIVMVNIVIPQALKSSIPPLVNEFISVLKETSILGYVSILDFARAGNIIRAKTYDPYFSLLFVAFGYLLIVVMITRFFKKIEKYVEET